MIRPRVEEFCEWAQRDKNLSRIRNALDAYPDLVEIKDNVSYDVMTKCHNNTNVRCNSDKSIV